MYSPIAAKFLRNTSLVFSSSFRFYGELNDFLPLQQRQVSFVHTFQEGASIKDLVESLGVPHPEIDLLLVCGKSVGFTYLVKEGDRVSVYPRFSNLDIAALSRVRPPTLSQLRFVADVHLGKLVRNLRILGFDVLYNNHSSDRELAHCSSRERRILLTRDRGLLKRSEVIYGYCLRSSDPEVQVLEVLHRYRAFDRMRPFQRCLRCNQMLEPVPKEDVCDRLPPHVRANHNDFRYCQTCDRIYWKGTHYQRMQKYCDEVARQLPLP